MKEESSEYEEWFIFILEAMFVFLSKYHIYKHNTGSYRINFYKFMYLFPL